MLDLTGYEFVKPVANGGDESIYTGIYIALSLAEYPLHFTLTDSSKRTSRIYAGTSVKFKVNKNSTIHSFGGSIVLWQKIE